MRTILILLLVVFIVPAASSQKLSGRPHLLAPYVAPKLDTAITEAMQRAILSYRDKKSKPMLKVGEALGGDKMPNGFKTDMPLTVYKGNNIYESTIDHMSILAPDFNSNMPVKGKQPNAPVLTPKAY